MKKLRFTRRSFSVGGVKNLIAVLVLLMSAGLFAQSFNTLYFNLRAEQYLISNHGNSFGNYQLNDVDSTYIADIQNEFTDVASITFSNGNIIVIDRNGDELLNEAYRQKELDYLEARFNPPVVQ